MNFGGKYEGGWFANFKYYTRYYDVNAKTSFLTDNFNQKWEFYKQNPSGAYKGLYDDSRFDKHSGSGNDAKAYGTASPISPLDLVIRDYFRNSSNLNPRIMYLDIETRTGTVSKGFPEPKQALEPVCLIQFLDSETQVVHIIGDKEFYYREWYLKQPDHRDKEVVYHHCSNEVAIFEKLFEFIENMKPAIVYAWNGEGFDFGYLFNRCTRLGLNHNKFSPFWRQFPEKAELVTSREQDFGGMYVCDLSVVGCFFIDIKRLYQKIVVAPRKSYSLDAIAQLEVKARKIKHDEFKTFDDFYQGNYTKPSKPTEDEKQTLCYQFACENRSEEAIKRAGYGQFVYYGVIDVVLLQEIDKKRGLTALMSKVSEMMNSMYPTILGTTKPWANAIRNRLYDSNVVVNSDVMLKRGVNLDKSINGGFVRDPIQGKFKWVMSADVNSMYPKLSIGGSNMSPETFLFARELSGTPEKDALREFAMDVLKVGTDKEQNENNLLEYIKDPENVAKLTSLLESADLAMAPNGTFYKKHTEGVIPKLVKGIYDERSTVKKAMSAKEQKIIEIDHILKLRNQSKED